MALMYSTSVPLGSGAIDFSLPGTDDRIYSLKSFKDADVLVVIFTCNHCPYAQAIWPRTIDLQARMAGRVSASGAPSAGVSDAGRGVRLVGINPNDAKNYPDDHPKEMKKKVKEWGINFPYLSDESQETARAYDAQCTPDLYVFDRDRKLRYHGRLDDNWQDPGKVKTRDLEDAVNALLAGRQPPEKQMPSMGCSIKWK
ncbi:thioredoxin family protein [bacterium]|nr:thioredoxin family protein [bacterium]